MPSDPGPSRYAVLFPSSGPPVTVPYGAATIGKGARLVVSVGVPYDDPWMRTNVRTRLLPEGRFVAL